MIETDQNVFFETAIFQSVGKEVDIRFIHFITGGCINQTIQLDTDQGSFFLKWNEEPMLEIFEKEAKGLRLLKENSSLTVPEVLGVGKIEQKSYLLLELVGYGPERPDYWETLGHQLAEMHQSTTNTQFGLEFNNYIGKLEQNNEFHDNWLSFFMEKRLRAQFGLAYYNGLIEKEFMRKLDALETRLEGFFPEEPASLLHGDLWSGNVMWGKTGEPCFVDPAVYFGHREMELAYTELFGGFEEEFYRAYNRTYPLESGYHDRKDIYNLYPLMVHVNLFGTSYMSGVERILKRYI